VFAAATDAKPHTLAAMATPNVKIQLSQIFNKHI